jgi:AcrR family transcriptional regulator
MRLRIDSPEIPLKRDSAEMRLRTDGSVMLHDVGAELTSVGRADFDGEDTAGAGAAQPMPIFRRPTPEDALDLARMAFLDKERVEIGSLAAQLSISRVTLNRWFGTRDKLIERVLVQLAGAFAADAEAEAEGDGEERILDFLRRLMDATVNSHPLRGFVAREPQLALRLLSSERGAVHERIAQALADVVAQAYSPERAKALEHNIDVIVRLGTALQWGTITIGEEPQTDEAVEILRNQLNASQSTPAPVSSNRAIASPARKAATPPQARTA